MDKKTLVLFTLLIIPGLGFLYTLFDTNFLNLYANSTEWYQSYTFIVILTIICFIASIGSIILIKFKKYETVDYLKDIRIKNEKKIISEFIYIKMMDINLNDKYNKEHVDNWVDTNYDEIIKDFNNKNK